MNKQQFYGVLVLAMFFGINCYSMEREISHDELVKVKDVPERLVIERKLTGLQLDLISRLKCHPSKPEFVFGSWRGKNVSYDLASDSFAVNQEYKASMFAYNKKGTLRADVSDYAIHIFDLKTNDVRFSYEVKEPILQVFFNSKGNQLIVLLVDHENFELPRNMVKILSVVKQKCMTEVLKCFRDKRHIGSFILPSSDNWKIACTTSTMSMDNEEVVIVDLITEKVQYLCEKKVGICYESLAFNADGTKLAGGRNDGNVMIWDLQNGTSQLVQYHPEPYKVGMKIALAYGPRNTLFSISDRIFKSQNSSKIDKLDVKKHKILKNNKITRLVTKSGKVLGSSFSDDGSKLAQVVQDEQGDVYFRYTYLLPKKCYSIEELAVMQHLYTQQLIAQKSSN